MDYADYTDSFVPEFQDDPDRRGAGQDTRGRVCSPFEYFEMFAVSRGARRDP
jgi:hypothetical protein